MKPEGHPLDKLYTVRDISADANFEVFEVGRDLDRQFKDHPNFVGTAPFGSKVRGYSDKISDLDETILIDAKNKEELTLIVNDVVDYCEALSEQKDFKVSPLFSNVNMEQLKKGLESEITSKEYITSVCAIADICNASKGAKVQVVLENIRNNLLSNNVENSKNILEIGSKYLAERDVANPSKISDRLGKPIDPNLHIEKRIEMWKKRMQKVLQVE